MHTWPYPRINTVMIEPAAAHYFKIVNQLSQVSNFVTSGWFGPEWICSLLLNFIQVNWRDARGGRWLKNYDFGAVSFSQVFYDTINIQNFIGVIQPIPKDIGLSIYYKWFCLMLNQCWKMWSKCDDWRWPLADIGKVVFVWLVTTNGFWYKVCIYIGFWWFTCVGLFRWLQNI